MRLVWSLQAHSRAAHLFPRIGPRVRLPQAKDVPEQVILDVLRSAPGAWWTSWPGHGWKYSLPNAAPELGAVPWKVLNAKLDGMQRRGLIDGCSCGCRGDWHIPELFYAAPWPSDTDSPLDDIRRLLSGKAQR